MNRKAVIVLAVFIMLFSVAAFSACNKKKEYSGEFRPSNRPEGGTLLDVTIPDDEQALKELAYYLYDNANKLDQQIEKRAYAVNHETDVIGLRAGGFRYEIKNQEEYSYVEYSFCLSDEPFVGIMLSVFNSVYAVRKYTNSWMDKMYVERAEGDPNNFYIVSTQDDTYFGQDGRLFQADWNRLVTGKNNKYGIEKTDENGQKYVTGIYVDKPPYMASQELTYEQTGQKIRVETIKNATVTKHSTDTGDYFRVIVDLDVNNPLTTESSLVELREGAGDEAQYLSIVSTFEVWDNGYFKYFLSNDSWSGGVISGDLDFETYFYYDDESCDIGNYQYMKDLATKCYAEATGGNYEAEIYYRARADKIVGTAVATAVLLLIMSLGTAIVKRCVK